MKRLLGGLCSTLLGLAGIGLGTVGVVDAELSASTQSAAMAVGAVGTVLLLVGLPLLLLGMGARRREKEAQPWLDFLARFPSMQACEKTVHTALGHLLYDYGLDSTEASTTVHHHPIHPKGTTAAIETEVLVEGIVDGARVQMGQRPYGYQSSVTRSTLWIHISTSGSLSYKLGLWTDRSSPDTDPVPLPPGFVALMTVRATDVNAAASLLADGQLLKQFLAVVRTGTLTPPTTLFWQYGEGFFECDMASQPGLQGRALQFLLAVAARASAQPQAAQSVQLGALR